MWRLQWHPTPGTSSSSTLLICHAKHSTEHLTYCLVTQVYQEIPGDINHCSAQYASSKLLGVWSAGVVTMQ